MNNNVNLDFIFIFPSDYFNEQNADEVYQQEYEAFKSSGLITALINVDQFSGKYLTKIEDKAMAIYRGWMISEDDYRHLYQFLQVHNIELVTTPEMYLKSHFLPQWYNSIAEYTPETVFCKNIDEARRKINQLHWDQYFIKDYVKSLKVDGGSSVTCEKELDIVLSKMLHYRDKIEGGICLRKYVDLEENTEKRYFVIDGKAYDNSGEKSDNQLLKKVVSSHEAYFYSVDIAKDKNGNEIVIEIGDGQVSDLVGWDVNDFVRIWSDALKVN